MSIPRIGLSFEYGTLNGGEFSMLSCLARLHPDRVKCVAFCPRETPLARELSRLGIPTVDTVPNVTDSERLAQFLNREIDRYQLQLLHANSLAMGRTLGRVAGDLKVPTTCHLRDILKLSPAAMNNLNRHAGRVAVSEAVRQFHVRQGLNPAHTVTILNGVSLTRFRPRQSTGFLHRELGLSPESRLIANIGQICLRKGQTDLARAAVLLRDRFPDLQFLFIGTRHSGKAESIAFEREMRDLFARANMADRCHCLGFRTDIAGILNEVTLLVHMARQEPLGRVLLEAAASGVPIVATNVGGTAEILEDGRSALLIPPGDSERCAAALVHLLDNSAGAAELARAARARAEQRFSVERAADELVTWWRDMITGTL